jgi:PEP-CTERM motif
MARNIIWLLAVLLISAAGLPKPAAAVTFEFIQTSDPATSDGYVAQGTVVIDAKGSVQEFDFGIAGFGVTLDSFIDLEPPQFGDLSIGDFAFDYYDGSSNFLAFDGMFGPGGIFLTDGPSSCFEGGCFFDGFWQMVAAALVPEPASFGLLASGVLGLAVLRRRTR